LVYYLFLVVLLVYYLFLVVLLVYYLFLYFYFLYLYLFYYLQKHLFLLVDFVLIKIKINMWRNINSISDIFQINYIFW
ncbi:hypothetical protein Mgra_00006572, partial [Meloidogyne graminicola]